MAAAMRDSATATKRAVDQMYHNRNSSHNNQNIPEEEGEDGNGRPMSLATFLKVKPPEFKGTVNVTEADDWFQAIERSLQAQQEKPNTGGQEFVVFFKTTMLVSPGICSEQSSTRCTFQSLLKMLRNLN
ncbi:hypothetical protein PIB30_092607 [Stylosanthes scabra]|uniref:Gag-protease polyprotein n=1 Tax=Stylosanthes scabra TaxID=79078 RepID=A0ABU6TUD6_9FABA|nr:hypothetical protein [Stylosanthes scabra]